MSFIDFCGRVAASYRRYWDEANKKLAAERQAAQDNATYTNMIQAYPIYADLIGQAINNCADAVGLQAVRDYSQLQTVNPVCKAKFGLWAFTFRARRKKYADEPARKVCRVLQAELDALCSCSYNPVTIELQYQHDNTIVIYMYDAAQYRRALMEGLTI